MSQPSDGHSLTRLQRLTLIAWAVLFFAACTDGYPTEDELVINPLELNQSERLDVMNQLGKEAHPEVKWLYRALPSCMMQITVEGGESGQKTFEMQLSGAGVSISFNKSDKVYGVQVQPREGESLEKRPILLSKTWVDAIEMGNLVRSFQVGCSATATTMPDNETEPS